MYEENRRFSWTSLFIKIIIVVIFILFTVWLLSLSNKGVSNSLNVLTDQIFTDNIDKMKEVGKSYFTTERLPEKIGDIKTLTLEKMYNEKLILELKDKNGNACSAKNSYVSIEKMENEYQMKVYLECGEDSDYVIVIMGCYNYCDSDICEKRDIPVDNKAIEYEYSKTTGGRWTDWGNWSEWSKVSVTKTSYRDVQTKTVKEEYTYDKYVTETKVMGDATCEKLAGYTLVSNKDGACTYSKTSPDTETPICPTVSGYTLKGISDGICSYVQDIPQTQEPSCDSTYNGAKLTKRDGFACYYSKKVKLGTTDPVCAKTYDGHDFASRSGFTCNYSKTNSNTSKQYQYRTTGSYVPSSSYPYEYVFVSVASKATCTGCSKTLVYTYDVYKYVTTTSTTTRTNDATCPDNYEKSDDTCVAYKDDVITGTAKCNNGYTPSGTVCVKYNTITKPAYCKNEKEYDLIDGVCVKKTPAKITKPAVCPKDQKMDGGVCTKDITKTVKTIGTRDVVYYRYRLREYVGGTTDYKWSSSNNDKSLLDAGYRLTGKTRNKGGK